jgi:phosphoribosyl isomerase A
MSGEEVLHEGAPTSPPVSARPATFTLLPAVDVADGHAVRPVQGEASTDLTDGPALDAALGWQAAGAEWIHLVDLDAAYGRGSNAELLARVIGELDVEVELAGGIGDDASLERALSTGCARVNLSTAALDDPAWCAGVIAAYGERIAVSLDVRIDENPDGSTQHRLAARGRSHEGGDLWETIAWLDQEGCARYIVTDVGRDGMLSGPNVELYRAVTRATPAPVIASGGIAAIEDLVRLAELAASGSNVEGSIVGKALYADRFTLPEALEAMGRVEMGAG